MRSRATQSLLMVAAVLLALSGHTWVAIAASDASTPEATPARQSQPEFSIIPVDEDQRYNFDVTVESGATITLTAGVVNVGETPVEIRTYAANAISLVNGGFGAGDEATAPARETTWLSYPSTTVNLNPDETWQQEFTVSVPAGTAPGE